MLLLVSVFHVLWNCNFMLTQNKYDLHSYDFQFSALTLLARCFRQNTVKSTASLRTVICKRKQQFREL